MLSPSMPLWLADTMGFHQQTASKSTQMNGLSVKSDYLPLCLVLKFVMLAALNWHRCTLCSGTRGHQSSQVKSSQVNWGERQIGAESCFCLLHRIWEMRRCPVFCNPTTSPHISISPHCSQSKTFRSKNIKIPCLRIFATNRKSLQRKL